MFSNHHNNHSLLHHHSNNNDTNFSTTYSPPPYCPTQLTATSPDAFVPQLQHHASLQPSQQEQHQHHHQQQQQQQQQQPGVKGGSSSPPTDLRSRARQSVDEAVRFLAPEDKAAYLEARATAPYLLEHETCPLKFLRRCENNPWEAAQRLCLYWKERKELFGPERAFLPLTLTGDGALSKDDVLSMQAGFPALLPDTVNGKKVAYCDRRQYVPSLNKENRLRGAFYTCHCLAEDERSQTEGCLILILLVTPRIQNVDYAFVHKAVDLVVNAMPIKAHWHLLNCLPKHNSTNHPQHMGDGGTDNDGNGVVLTNKHYVVQDLIASYVRSLVSKGIRLNEDMDIHMERADGELLELLTSREMGLRPEGIPTALGGSWTFVESISWCRQQALRERQKFKSLLAAANKRKKNIEKQKAQAAAAAEPTSEPSGEEKAISAQEKAAQAAAQKLSKRRATNVLHSRRKRERRRQELQSLTQERDQLAKEHQALKAEEGRLTALVKQAQRVVEQHRAGETIESSGQQHSRREAEDEFEAAVESLRQEEAAREARPLSEEDSIQPNRVFLDNNSSSLPQEEPNSLAEFRSFAAVQQYGSSSRSSQQLQQQHTYSPQDMFQSPPQNQLTPPQQQSFMSGGTNLPYPLQTQVSPSSYLHLQPQEQQNYLQKTMTTTTTQPLQEAPNSLHQIASSTFSRPAEEQEELIRLLMLQQQQQHPTQPF